MKKYLFIIALSLLSFVGYGQGLEDFTNSNATASYNDNNFIGNNSVTWTYIESRDENNDGNSSGIDGNALMLRYITENSKITSSTISGGIGDFSVKLYKGFTGSGNRQVELFINGVSKGTSTAFDDFNEHTFTINDIDVSGDIIIEIRNITTEQCIIDDITWTTSGTPCTSQTITFGSLSNVDEGDSNFNLTATTSSSLTITYTSSNNSVATISGNTVTIVGGGTANITASQSGDATYCVASDIVQSLTVIPTAVVGTCIEEGFDNGTTTPTGWTFTNIGGTYTSATNFGVSSPSLKLDNTGDIIETPTVTSPSELSFWIKGQGTNSSSALLVEGWDGSWNTIENITNSIPTTGTIKTYSSGLDTYTKFRFTYTKSVGNLSFDDVKVTCGEIAPIGIYDYVQIESIMINSCGDSEEGPNEMFRFRVDSIDLCVDDIVIDWNVESTGENIWRGVETTSTITTPIVDSINAHIENDGLFLEPISCILPAGVQVLFVTSTDFEWDSFDWSDMVDTLYIVFQVAGATAGHFSNTASTPRTLSLDFTGYDSDSVTFTPSLSDNSDGSGVDFDDTGNPTYSNCGCRAPYVDILPIELNYFEKDCSGFEWETQTEINNDYFTIQKTSNLSYWVDIATINGAGNSTSPMKYSYKYEKNSPDTYYRLVQTDFDGESEYFNIITNNCDDISNVKVYPNPSKEGYSIIIDGDFKNLKIFDIFNRKIVDVGKIENIDTLKAGIYIFLFDNKFKFKVIVL